MMENKYEEYFEKEAGEWHRYKVGEYHISAIGLSNKDLDDDEHGGPCLKKLFQRYKDEITMTDDEIKAKHLPPLKRGIFKYGNTVHEMVQTRRKTVYPWMDMEFAIKLELDLEMETIKPTTLTEPTDKKILILGSIDMIDRFAGKIIDIKTASRWTMPGGENDYSVTHGNQTRIYSSLYNLIFRAEELPIVENVTILYIRKDNWQTNECDVDYDHMNSKDYVGEFIDRVVYFHNCLINNVEPDPEPNKWCKYCDLKDRCDGYDK